MTQGSVSGQPRLLLRIEGGTLAGLAGVLYGRFGASWWLFLALVLAPDAGMVGYLRGSRLGAAVYNGFHTYLPPAILSLIGVLAEVQLAYSLGLIWFAHIGVDRLFGFGLKYPDSFRHTHLGTIGKD